MKARNPTAGDAHAEEKLRRQHQPIRTRSVSHPSVSCEERKSAGRAASTAVAKSNSEPEVTTKATESIEYKGHVLKVEPQRFGWKVAIFPKESPFALHRSAYTLEVGERGVVIEKAKAIVDGESANNALHNVTMKPAKSSKRSNLGLVAFFLRFGRSVLQGWATAKRIYFSVDRPQRG